MAFGIKENTDKYDWTATKKMIEARGLGLRFLTDKTTQGFCHPAVGSFELMSVKMKEISDKIKQGW